MNNGFRKEFIDRPIYVSDILTITDGKDIIIIMQVNEEGFYIEKYNGRQEYLKYNMNGERDILCELQVSYIEADTDQNLWLYIE